MNIRFFYNGTEKVQAYEDYINEKIAKFDKYLDNILQVEVEIEEDKKGLYRVEVMVHTPYKLYRAEEKANEPMGAMDMVEEALKLQFRRDKDKITTLRRRGARSIKKKLAVDEKARF